MLHVNHNIQTLQLLADELLEVGRTSCDSATPSDDNVPKVISVENQNFSNDFQDLNSCDETESQKNQNNKTTLQMVDMINANHDEKTNLQTVDAIDASHAEKTALLMIDVINANHDDSDAIFESRKKSFNQSVEPPNGEVKSQRNQSPMKNLRNLLERKTNQTSPDAQAAEIAQKLFNSEGEKKRDILPYFLKKDDFSVLVADKYMKIFDFSNVAIDESLRILLKKLALEGESQEREKVLYQFACRYKECNPRFLNGNLDSIHVLICATALLNTDLHGVRTDGWRRMTLKQFMQNLSGVSKDGQAIPQNLLKEIYRSIKKQPLPSCDGNDSSAKVNLSKSMSSVNKQSKPTPGSFSRSQSMKRSGTGSPPVLDDVRKVGSGRSSKTKTIPRKQGILWRKAIFESDGNKTVRRKRKWKLFMVALQGLELHLIKKEASDVCRIPLHHCLAEMEAVSDATRRQNVFRLTLANRSTALYQAESKDETESWVNAINRNAALLSAAPLSAGIGSEVKFRRPLMPTAHSTLPLIKQLADQERRLVSLLADLRKTEEQPSVGLPTATKEFNREKMEYLNYEIRKYEVYTKSLSELVDAQSPILRENGLKHAEKSAVDTQSLLSVCPSEPGLIKASSSYQSSEDGGSYEDLIDPDKVNTLKRPRGGGASTSFLVPTSSLPSLLPLDGDFLLSPTTPYFPSYFTEVSPSPSREFYSRSSYAASFAPNNESHF